MCDENPAEVERLTTFPRPMKLPKKPPTIAPAMPMRIVTKNPPGSFPGMMARALQ